MSQPLWETPRLIAKTPAHDAARPEVIVAEADGAPLNSPNDVTIASDGTILFTDPSYGFLLSFDDRHLYVGDSATVIPGFPDGLKVGRDGRLSVTPTQDREQAVDLERTFA
jgi:hypothetical protein